MKRRYILIMLLLLIGKNVVELSYEGPASDRFLKKWRAMLKSGEGVEDSDSSSHLASGTHMKSGERNWSIDDYSEGSSSGSNSTERSSLSTIAPYGEIVGSIAESKDNVSSTTLVGVGESTTTASNATSNEGENSRGGVVVASAGVLPSTGSSSATSSAAIPKEDLGTGFGVGPTLLGGPGGPGSGDPSDPYGGSPPPDTPLDGGLSLLLAIAIGKGAKSLRFYSKKNKKNLQEQEAA